MTLQDLHHSVSTRLDTDLLAACITGRVITAADPDWGSAKLAWNVAVELEPAFVVQVGCAADVAEVVAFARDHGLRVAPQATGHNAAPLGDLAATVLLRTDRLREVSVDAQARTVRVGAGVVWGEVTQALAPHGLTALAGSSADVGVVGYTLGGGYSWLSRKHGLASSSVTGIDIVTGDGVFRRITAADKDLFWAVRGAGANLGVVCALEFEVLPMAEVYAGWLMFPLDRAAEVFAAYERWTRDLDEAATTCIRLLRLPPLPELPDFLRGQSFAMIDGAIDLPDVEAARLLEPLRALGPAIDTFAMMPTAMLSQLHMDPPGPTPGIGDGFILEDLSAATIDALLAAAGPACESALLAVDLRHLGGAVGRPDPRGGAIDHLPGRFLGFSVGVAPFPEAAAAVHRDLETLITAIRPWRSDRDYLNFRESTADAESFFEPNALGRLQRLQAFYNQDQLVRSNHPLQACHLAER